MGRSFSTRRGTTRIVFGRGSVDRLGPALDALAADDAASGAPPLRRILVVATAGRAKDAELVANKLAGRSVGTLAIAKEHVPEPTIAEAQSAALRAGADALLAFGGGSAIGLAKALAVQAPKPLPILAIPTTYSGSEMTPVWGMTKVEKNGPAKKVVGRDERARPRLVVYDPTLGFALPRDVTLASLWNAIAHAVEATWAAEIDRPTLAVAEDALRLLAPAASRLAAHIDDHDAREIALEGAYLAGVAFADAGGALHHKICHILGGSFGLPHAKTHAALLRHVVRWTAASAPHAIAPLARALGVIDPVAALDALARSTGIALGLDALGFDKKAIPAVVDAVLAAPPLFPRLVDREGLTDLLVMATTPAPARKPPPPLRAPETIASQPGFGSTLESEVLPGALPRRQNAPRPAPYGLYPELLSGTPFTVKNVQNSRVWMYRIRPSFSHSVFRTLPASRFGDDLGEVEPNRTRWAPAPIPAAPEKVDFLDGLATLGGDGTSRGPGYAVSLYAANADMGDRAFSTADGDLLIVPQDGTLDVRTELGFLRVRPGGVLVIPRAIKFSVGLPDGQARGWLLEVFGPRLRLPERGLIGSNGLADARHFQAPVASYEDRLCPDGFEIVHKLGGRLHTATQEHSPFDVVAWHGAHLPFSYDLMLFNAMGSVTFDHVDPSIHTVLTAPLDDYGRAVVDFVVFRGRWDVAEHSFRPPFMHRNAATEINGVVHAASVDSGYVPGCTFVSPLLTSHGISTASYDGELEAPDDKHEGPRRMSDASLWIMFESALPFRPTRWAQTTPLLDPTFLRLFDGMKKRFDPKRP